ncbi:MAG: hypothetical protein J6Q82_03705 [Clostridia bacterium]|nr:hypothetical protein [Clostridia bacterium]
MTVKELANAFDYEILCLPDEAREIRGGYAGDLLSWVMGKLDADSAWVTIMSNVNIIAVATLTDPSCIILSEGVSPDEGVLARAEQQGINLLSAKKTTFEVCADLASML